MIDKAVKLVRYIGPLWRPLAWFVLITLVAAVLESASFASLVPLLEILSSPDSLSSRTLWAKQTFEAHGLNALVALAAVFCILIFLSQAMLLYSAMYSARFTGVVTNDWRRAIFTRVLQGDIEGIGSGKTSIIMDIVYTQTKSAAAFLRTLCTLVTKGLLSAVLAALLLWSSPVATLIIAAVFLGVFLVIRPLFQRKATEYGVRSVKLGRRLMGVLHETLTGYREVQIFNLQSRQTARLNEANEALLANALRRTLISQLPTVTIPLGLAVVTLVLVIYFISMSTTTFSVNMPLLVLFLVVGQRLGGAVASAVSGWLELRMGLPAFVDVCDLARGHREAPRSGLPVPALHTDIRLRELSFGYPGRARLFERLNLVLAKGRVTALVGASGSGKSTIADLITGLRRPSAGDVLVNDLPLSAVDLDDWRARIGYVSQASAAFDATVAENIRLGKPNATKAEIIDVARTVRAHDFIGGLEKGYDTQLGDKGGRLSGGERQRIAIARALIRDPDLLIFDEPTNGLDAESRASFEALLHELVARGKTILLITHDRESIPPGARIVDMAALQGTASVELAPIEPLGSRPSSCR